MIERRQEIDTLHGLLKRHPVVGIIGVRQIGKTTLVRFFVKESPQKSSYYDLENPEDMARLADPMAETKNGGLINLIRSYSFQKVFEHS